MIKYESVGYNQNVCLDTLRMPLYVYLELNNSCNLRCKFCSVSSKSNNYIELDTVKKIIKELRENGIYDIYYTGGEPLLYPNFEELVEYASELGMRQTLLTNGILLRKYQNILGKILCICVSLHGSKQVHNELTNSKCFDDVLANIEFAKKLTNVKINYTVISDNQNIDEMKFVLDYGKKHNIPISFAKYNNIGEGKNNKCYIDINEFVKNLDLLKNEEYNFSVNDCIAPCTVEDKYLYLTHGCGAGYLFCSIDYLGNVKICPSSSNYIGNMKKNSFKKIWNQSSMKKYRKFKWIPEYCKVCKNLTRCRCGCKIELGSKLCTLNDFLVKNEMEKIWNKIKNKHMKLNVSILRKEGKNFVSLSNPSRKYNLESMNVIKKINDGIKLEELENYKNLVIALYRDEIIKEDD